MNKLTLFFRTAGIAWACMTGLMLMSCADHQDHADHNDPHGHEEEEVVKGPNNGRLLRQDDFAVELTIFETGVPPEFRVYAYHQDELLAPETIDLSIELIRTGDRTDRIGFVPQQGFLRGDMEIYEPHSFEVVIVAVHEGKEYRWRYDNFEGRTAIAQDVAAAMGVVTAEVAPAVIAETITVNGSVAAMPDRQSKVHARYPGVIRSVNVDLGDRVSRGDVLATVQSNESLKSYDVTSPIDGDIVQLDARNGEMTGAEPLFSVTDTEQVRAELSLFPNDISRVMKGSEVIIESLDGDAVTRSRIDWVSPVTSDISQSVRAVAVIENPNGEFRPGQFVRARITVAEHQVPLAVRRSAIQSFRDFQVVYAVFGDTYEVRMLELGRGNHDWVEVLGGIEPGTRYVTENSYLIKADIEKSGASHDH